MPYTDAPPCAVVLMDYHADFSNAGDPPWGDVSEPSNHSTERGPTAPVNPNTVGRVRFSAGYCDGTGPPPELITFTGSGHRESRRLVAHTGGPVATSTRS